MNSLLPVLYLGADKAGVDQRTRTRKVEPRPEATKRTRARP